MQYKSFAQFKKAVMMSTFFKEVITPMSDQKNMLDTLLKALEDLQAIDVTVIDVREQTTVTDYMIICSGRSSRHVKAVADSAIEQMKLAGMPSLSANGLESGDWVLIDFGDYVLHVMQADSRAFYNIEGLWQNTNTQPKS